MRYAFVREHAGSLPVRAACRVLNVRPSGYYAWVKRSAARCVRQARELELLERIRTVHRLNRNGVYGSPRVHRALRKDGVSCSRRRVETLMRREGIRSVCRRRYKVRTTDAKHEHPVAPNLLDRQFERSGLDQAWVTDITYVATGEGWLYVATVMDLCSRRIVGWSTADHLRAELASEALEKAIEARCPAAGLLHHSDRGVQYACGAYQAVLAEHGITCSMSRGGGDCYDNAAMESFFKTFKVELVYQEQFATRKEADEAIYPYIELFYNRQRLHSSLGYRSPAEFEAQLRG
jgi:transposase InsO family protein